MKIGTSLFLNVLLPKNGGTDTSPWNMLFPSINDLLSLLKQEGIQFIEIKLPAQFTAEEMRQVLTLLVNSEFEYTFHAPTCSDYPDRYDDYIQPLVDLAQLSEQEFGRSSLIVIHSLSGSSIEKEVLIKRSRDFLHNVLDSVAQSNFKIVVEILRDATHNGKIRSGTTYLETLEITNNIGEAPVGICWDFGHSYAQAERGLQARIPPSQFMKNVCHTHIHDYKNDITHIPLGHGLVPYQLYIQRLIQNGYDGIFNLELNPERIADPQNFPAYLVQSIRILKLVLKGIESVT